MKFVRLQRFYRYPFGTTKQYFVLVRENMSLEDIFSTLRPQIRKPIALLLDRNTNVYGQRIIQKIQDYVTLRKFKVYPVYDIKQNIKTTFKDITPYITILKKYPPVTSRWDIIPITKEGYESILLYTIDTNSPVVEDFEDSIIYPLLKRWLILYRKGELVNVPDHLILTLVNENKITYLPLIVNREYKYLLSAINIIKAILKKLSKKNKTSVLPDNQVETIVNEVIEDKEKEADDRTQDIIMTEKKKLGVIVKLASQGARNSDDVLNKFSKIAKRTPINSKLYVRKLEDKNIILKPEPLRLDKNISPVHKIDESIVADGLQPVQVEEFVKIEFRDSLKTLQNLINSYSEPFGLTVIKANVEHIEPKDNDLAPSDSILVTFELVDYKNNHHKIQVKLPRLREDGTLLINGKRWYIVNQLALLPITFPKKGVGKFTSYTGSFMIERMKKYTKIMFAGHIMPITFLLSYLYGFDYLMKKYGIEYSVVDKPEKGVPYLKLTNEKYLQFPKYKDYDEFKQDLIRSFLPFKNIEKVETNHDPLTKDWFLDIIKHLNESEYADRYIQETVKIIVDKRTREILEERNEPTNLRDILFYMYEKVVEGFVTDRNDLTSLRNRAYEQLVHVAFDVIKTEIRKYVNYQRYGKDVTLKLNPDKVFSSIITSSAVRMLEYSNPLEEVINKQKVTFAGYNGIPSDAVPDSIKGIHKTYFGNIDPVDTPEGATTGVNQTYTIGATLATKYGAVIPHELTDDIKSGMLSLSTASSPFIDKTEPTRGIMISNQVKQAVALKDSEPPAVMSGVELLVPKLSSEIFVHKAPCDGSVVAVTDKQITIECSDGLHVINLKDFEIARSGQGYHSSIRQVPVVKKGQKVSRGEILTNSNHIKDGILSMGKNLVATYMFWKGYTYEDGIVVSEDVVDKLTSVHIFEYFTFLNPTDKLVQFNVSVGQKVEAGDILIQAVSEKLYNLIEYGLLNEDEIFIQGNKYTIRAKHPGIVKDIKIFDNSGQVLDPSIIEKAGKYIQKSNDTYYYKGRKFDGVFIYVYIESELPLEIGDKLTNRHAAKGVVCAIEPVKNMPKLKDGRHVQIIINPLSVINRTNMGQYYELYAGEISYQLGKIVLENPKNTFLKVLDNIKFLSPRYITSLLRSLQEDKNYNDLIRFVRRYKIFPMIYPPFETPTYKEILSAMKILMIPERYEVELSEFGIKTKVPVGMMYIYKLEHMSSNKIHARSLGPYTKVGQATAGKRAEGGQRLGEQDVWALAAYDAENIIEELFSAGADDFRIKRQIYRQIIKEGEASIAQLKEGDKKAKQYVEMLFKAIMVDL